MRMRAIRVRCERQRLAQVLLEQIRRRAICPVNERKVASQQPFRRGRRNCRQARVVPRGRGTTRCARDRRFVPAPTRVPKPNPSSPCSSGLPQPGMSGPAAAKANRSRISSDRRAARRFGRSTRTRDRPPGCQPRQRPGRDPGAGQQTAGNPGSRRRTPPDRPLQPRWPICGDRDPCRKNQANSAPSVFDASYESAKTATRTGTTPRCHQPGENHHEIVHRTPRNAVTHRRQRVMARYKVGVRYARVHGRALKSML